MEIVCCLQLADSQVVHHLTPPALHPSVKKLWVVRSRRPGDSEIPKAHYRLATARWKPVRLLQMFWHCLRLARRPEVRLFVSFNPFPYGLIAAAAARLAGKPVHFGFIGSDWHRDVKGRWGRWLLPLLRRAWLISAPGTGMLREMLGRGLDGERLMVLPHCLDLARFPVADPVAKDYDCLFVGRLIALKRVDVILDAFRRVVETHPAARLGIVGDGPQRPRLEALADRFGIAGHVHFVGQVPQVQPYLGRARILVMASEREGLPYALIEAASSGLVPVCTPVGEVPGLIRHGENGFLFSGDPAELAALLARLLDDGGLYQRTRANALAARQLYGYEACTRAWSPWLDRLAGEARA